MTFHGWIKDKAEYSDGSTALVLSVDSLNSENSIYSPVSGKVRITVTQSVPDYSYGDELTVTGRLTRPSPRRNPGEFDYRAYLERKGIFAQLRVRNDTRLDFYSSNKGFWIMREIVIPVRNKMSELRQTVHKGKHLAFIQAVVMGERRGIDREILDDFRTSGTMHILAISGLHV